MRSGASGKTPTFNNITELRLFVTNVVSTDPLYSSDKYFWLSSEKSGSHRYRFPYIETKVHIFKISMEFWDILHDHFIKPGFPTSSFQFGIDDPLFIQLERQLERDLKINNILK